MAQQSEGYGGFSERSYPPLYSPVVARAHRELDWMRTNSIEEDNDDERVNFPAVHISHNRSSNGRPCSVCYFCRFIYRKAYNTCCATRTAQFFSVSIGGCLVLILFFGILIIATRFFDGNGNITDVNQTTVNVSRI